MAFKRIRENLSIYPFKDQIIQHISMAQVVVIEGETGSGKSTQIPQWCLEVSQMSRVVCTQPRRIAAICLATRVAQEMGVTLGADDVGYIVRFDNKSVKTQVWSTVFIRIVAGAIIYFEAYFPQKYFLNF